jgi:hypothetical protein
VHEDVTAAFAFDEPVPLSVVEPLDLACDAHRFFFLACWWHCHQVSNEKKAAHAAFPGPEKLDRTGMILARRRGCQLTFPSVQTCANCFAFGSLRRSPRNHPTCCKTETRRATPCAELAGAEN